MGQYRLTISFRTQICFGIRYEHKYLLSIELPFMQVSVGLMNCASGVKIF